MWQVWRAFVKAPAFGPGEEIFVGVVDQRPDEPLSNVKRRVAEEQQVPLRYVSLEEIWGESGASTPIGKGVRRNPFFSPPAMQYVAWAQNPDPLEPWPKAFSYRLSTKDPAAMPAAQINRELDRLGDIQSMLGRALIKAGRGHDRWSEIAAATDPLARRVQAAHARQEQLRAEVTLRAGKLARRLPKGARRPRHNPPAMLSRGDPRERDLERRAAAGDPSAQQELVRIWLRTGRGIHGDGSPAYLIDIAGAVGLKGSMGSPGYVDRAQYAKAIRAVLKALEIKAKDVSVRTPRHSMAGSVDIAFKGPHGRVNAQLASRVFGTRHVGSMYVYGREDRSDARFDHFEPGGPMLDADYQGVFADALIKAQPKTEPEQLPPKHGFRVGQVVKFRGKRNRKRFVVTGISEYRKGGGKGYNIQALTGGPRASRGTSVKAKELELAKDQSLPDKYLPHFEAARAAPSYGFREVTIGVAPSGEVVLGVHSNREREVKQALSAAFGRSFMKQVTGTWDIGNSSTMILPAGTDPSDVAAALVGAGLTPHSEDGRTWFENPMDPELQRRLERLKHYKTRYEVVAESPEGTYLVGYTPRRSQRGLRDLASQMGEHLIRLTGQEEYSKLKPLTLGGYVIKLSGRTQREAYVQGELPWVGDL